MLTTESEIPNVAQDILGEIIHEERRDILEEIDSLTPEQLESFSHYMPIDLRDYVSKQSKWIQDSIYFLGIDRGRVPTAAEISDKLLNTDYSMRYRAYYALKYPHKVVKYD
jgi:hypothetical protein